MRVVGFTLDAVILGLAAYWTLQNPVVVEIQRVGFVPFITGLPTPLGANATGLLIDLNSQHPVVDARTAVVVQQWYNYLLDSDIGHFGRRNPETQYFVASNVWKDSLILPAWLVESLPHFIAGWLRNMLAGWTMYYCVGGMWGLWMYVIRGKHFYPNEEDKPTWEDLRIHLRVSTAALVFYTLAPSAGEWAMERGFTLAYNDFGGVKGWSGYLLWLVVYMTFVVSVRCGVRPIKHSIAQLCVASEIGRAALVQCNTLMLV